jgi:hypothetical protein
MTDIGSIAEVPSTVGAPSIKSGKSKRSADERRKFYKNMKNDDEFKGKYSSFFENLTKNVSGKSIRMQGNYLLNIDTIIKL